MPNRAYKKPSLKKFREVVMACKGFRGDVAKALNVSRLTVNKWCHDDPAFNECFAECGGRILDECLKSARQLAIGIAKTKKVDGKMVLTGWVEKPDGQMLRYLIGKYGRDEGFAESIDITSNGETINAAPAPTIVEIIDRREQVRRPEQDEDAAEQG